MYKSALATGAKPSQQSEHLNQFMLSIPRNLDLDVAEDRNLLFEAADAAFVGPMVRTYLDDYLSLFPDKHWRLVQGGYVGFPPGTDARSWTFQIEHIVDVARSLSRLRRFEGFDRLKAGLANPSQIGATVFEIQIAEWCSDRSVTSGLEFSPEVMVRGKIKRPEIRWETRLGAIYCECKQASIGESAISKRVGRVHGLLEKARKELSPWDESLRLDVEFDYLVNGFEARLANVVRNAFKTRRRTTFFARARLWRS